MVWGEMYVPSQGQTDSQQAVNDIHFGPDGLPKPPRAGSKAEIIQVEHQAQGHETWKYRTWDGNWFPRQTTPSARNMFLTRKAGTSRRPLSMRLGSP